MKSKVSSNKSFGLVFFMFFLIVSLYPLFNNEQIRIWSLIISLMFLLVSLMYAKILTPLNIIWSKLGILLGTLISPIVMAAVFFIVVTPTALIMRILGKNLLSLKKINKKTYWIERSSKKSMMKNQF
jgi:hypothetical protein